MFKLSSIRHHHIAIAAICSLVLASIYQSIVPLPEANADTVTIIIDTENTFTSAEIPCGSIGVENSDCGLGDLDMYFNSYLNTPANTTNKQFKIVLGSTINQINLTQTINLSLPRACANCSIEFDGTTASNNKAPILSSTNPATSVKPGIAFLLSDNQTATTIKNAHFQGFTESAIQVSNISANTHTITNNYFGALNGSSQSNTKAVTILNSSNTVIQNNTFGGNNGNAIELNGSTTQNTRISTNLFGVSSSSDLTSTLPAITESAIVINGANSNSIEGNIITNSGDTGIKILSGNNNTISDSNRFFNNTNKAISLLGAANGGLASPVLDSVQKQNNIVTIKGTGTSGANISFYRANNLASPVVIPDSTGGEGFIFLGSAIIDSLTDRNQTSGQFEFALSLTAEIGQIITSFQTLNENSSAFSNNVPVTQAPIPTPTPTPTPTSTPTPTPTPTITPTPSANRLPIANAGSDQNAVLNTVIQLHGEGSIDPDGDQLGYRWEQHSSDLYKVNLSSNTSSTPIFTTPSTITELQTNLHFSLEVNDGRGGISRDEVTIHISRDRVKPVANLLILPAERVAPGTEIILDGSNSILDSSSVQGEYHFRQVGNTQIGVTIDQESLSSSQARVLIPASLTRTTSFTFSLQVSDNNLLSDIVTATVEVAPQSNDNELCTDELPNANAGTNQTLSKPAGNIVVLNGMRSNDPNNTQLNYSWRQLSGGIRVDMRNTNTGIVNFTIPAFTTSEITLSFSLTVTNTCGQSGSDITKVTLKNADLDNDGMSNEREEELKTDPYKKDTDDDGLSDYDEIKNFCLNPLNTDSDNDGLKDGEEDINHNGITDGGETNPCLYDTDGDGLPDGFEKRYQLNPLNPQDAKEDIDNDNLTNIEEFVYKTNPTVNDTDSDGLPDGVEVKGLNRTNPIKDDTDNDGIIDGNEDRNHNGITDGGETSPVRFDSDFDGLADGLEIGLGNTQGKHTDLTKFMPDLDPISKTSPLTPDTDGDGILDGIEDKNRNGGIDCGETNPLDTQNLQKPCASSTMKPTPIKKDARTTDPNSIKVQKPLPTPTSSGLVQLVSPLSNFSISVERGDTNQEPNLGLPSINFNSGASIFVLPGLLSNTIPSILVLSSKL